MEIGKQIKQLRMRRGVTQEAMAQQLNVTAQAISKWERGVTTPDITILPEISAFFGVTIDDLFNISDVTRMERIRNMLWDTRYYDPVEVETTRVFLQQKGRKEPENGEVYELLAEMENHLASEHAEKAVEYAKEALRRDPDLRAAHSELNLALEATFLIGTDATIISKSHTIWIFWNRIQTTGVRTCGLWIN